MIREISSKFNFWTKIWLLTQCAGLRNLRPFLVVGYWRPFQIGGSMGELGQRNHVLPSLANHLHLPYDFQLLSIGYSSTYSKVFPRSSITIQTVQEHLIPFWRAITRPWVGQQGRLWYILVEEGLKFFFEVWWTHLSWLEGYQKSSWKLKNRVFGILCQPSEMPKSS